MSKPITLYGHAGGPNPWKVAIILEELGLPYTHKLMDFGDLKKDPFESLNPNGRVPAIEDPNTGVTLWESGAIVQYLVDTYDKTNNLSYGDKSPEKFYVNQWLHYQVSGQGPYYGQAVWFQVYHEEKNITSAIDRYKNEVKRVCKVIDSHLAKQGTPYLVGSKCTYADLAFVPWNMMIPFFMGGTETIDSLPHFKKWHDSLMARPAVAKVAADKQAANAK